MTFDFEKYLTEKLGNIVNELNFTDDNGNPETVNVIVTEEQLFAKMKELIPNNSINSNNPVFFENYSDALLYKLKTSTSESLKEIPDVTEGLENRILSALSIGNNINKIINEIVTKRYTLSRIKRIMISLLFSVIILCCIVLI